MPYKISQARIALIDLMRRISPIPDECKERIEEELSVLCDAKKTHIKALNDVFYSIKAAHISSRMFKNKAQTESFWEALMIKYENVVLEISLETIKNKDNYEKCNQLLEYITNNRTVDTSQMQVDKTEIRQQRQNFFK